MPYGDPDPEDPHVLIGVLLPADRASLREMAVTFAEEFAALGYGAERLMALFKEPFYAGAHQAFKVLGEAEVRRIVQECVTVRGGCRVVVHDAPSGGADSKEEPCPR
jgi:hypothetical protein